MIFKDEKPLRRASRSGFTVVEVIVASSILLISVLAVTSAFSYARRTVSRTENRLASLHIAREVMETLRNEPYASTLLTIGNNKQLPNYPRARGHYDVKASGGVGLAKDITVVIDWEEPADAKKIHSISLTTSHSRGLHR